MGTVTREKDIQILARTIIGKGELQDDHGSYCLYCPSVNTNGDKIIVHTLDCPVLVARDILTGVPS